MRSIGRAVFVFVCGAGTLGLEVLAGRAMSPAFGNSIYIWGAVLSLTLLFLAIGYEWGGRLGDRLKNPQRRLYFHVLIAAVWIATYTFWGGMLLRVAVAAGSYLGPLVAACGLLGPSVTLLATVVPLIFRAEFEEDPSRPGTVMGRLFAFSTLGSVLGALLTAYLAVPLLGVSRSFYIVAGLLFLACLPRMWRGRDRTLDIGIVLLFVFGLMHLFPIHHRWSPKLRSGVQFLHREASPYAQLDVLYDERDGSRVLLLDGAAQNWASGRDWRRNKIRYGTDLLELLNEFPSEKSRMLVVGLGGGTVAREFAAAGYDVECVELDPALLPIAVQWFDFPSAEIPVHIREGRSFLREAVRNGTTWDVIFLDVFGGGTPPEHMYTLEAMREARAALSPGGVFAANLPTLVRPGEDEVYRHVGSTLKRVFGNVAAIGLSPRAAASGELTNVLLLASDTNPEPFASLPYRRAVLDIPEELPPVTDDSNHLARWNVRANARTHETVRSWLGAGAQIP